MKVNFVAANFEFPAEESLNVFSQILKTFTSTVNLTPSAPSPCPQVPIGNTGPQGIQGLTGATGATGPKALPASPRVKKAVRQPKKSAAETPAASTASVEPSTEAHITALLKAKPMTTGEIIQASPHSSSPAIYSALSLMRKKGIVVNNAIPGRYGSFNFLKEVG
jgi:hypothetical protein